MPVDGEGQLAGGRRPARERTGLRKPRQNIGRGLVEFELATKVNCRLSLIHI